jgi:hypothetical protein
MAAAAETERVRAAAELAEARAKAALAAAIRAKAEQDVAALAAARCEPDAKRQRTEPVETLVLPRNKQGEASWVLSDKGKYGKTRATVRTYNGNVGVDVRKFEASGFNAESPTKVGIWLNAEGWRLLRDCTAGIDQALEEILAKEKK